jgi:hypothetical protein
MSRYIDIEPILEWCDNPEVFEPYGVNSVELERKIRQAPSIEIIRCGECKRANYEWSGVRCGLSDALMGADGFCSIGERSSE